MALLYQDDNLNSRSPKRQRTWNSDDDSGDDTFKDYEETIATLPVHYPFSKTQKTQKTQLLDGASATLLHGARGDIFSSSPPATVPTQLVITKSTQAVETSEVEVAASSPVVKESPRPHNYLANNTHNLLSSPLGRSTPDVSSPLSAMYAPAGT